ncbi:MAG: SDR family NAD(P)-dependent oxidoreductase, partial [Clostridiales bacterium]|nr:SDR family NAD(P)-dependent oxidoreductase [Clostridiales bacterium]
MTILVTGGTGYIGSHTCVELLNLGMDVVIVDNLVNSSLESMKRVQAITGKTPVFYDLDVRDEEKLSRVFEEHHIDC